jgi:hypothetical protein
VFLNALVGVDCLACLDYQLQDRFLVLCFWWGFARKDHKLRNNIFELRSELEVALGRSPEFKHFEILRNRAKQIEQLSLVTTNSLELPCKQRFMQSFFVVKQFLQAWQFVRCPTENGVAKRLGWVWLFARTLALFVDCFICLFLE